MSDETTIPSNAEAIVAQIDDEDTLVTTMPRAGTSCDWPPEPPLPAEVELAQGTEPPTRIARIYVAVRRPTTSNEST